VNDTQLCATIMSYTLGEAAKATGKSKAAISRAIKTGRMSAQRQDDGSFRIDPAELHRIYPPVDKQQEGKPLLVNPDVDGEIRELRAKLEAATTRLTEKDETITDLRTRLDREGEERRQAQAQLTALLTDQSQTRPKTRRWAWLIVIAVAVVALILLAARGVIPVRSLLP
jgi:hypothetical protein